MSGIAIVVPTLTESKGYETGKLALATAGCSIPVRLVVVHDSKKEGFTKAVNRGLRQAEANEDVCLLNDDITEFPHGWLETLREVLHSNEKYGLSGPSGKSAASPMRDGKPGQEGIRVVRQISFWCVLMKRAMIDELGFLDESFIHYRSDNWYCDVMRKKGWKCVWARAVFLKHRHHGSGLHEKWRKHDAAIYSQRKGK